jgi:hypothetical protein
LAPRAKEVGIFRNKRTSPEVRVGPTAHSRTATVNGGEGDDRDCLSCLVGGKRSGRADRENGIYVAALEDWDESNRSGSIRLQVALATCVDPIGGAELS